MMKRMCDCGCDHAITEYDAGQTPIIIQRGNLLLEIRVLPGPTGERPNVRPVCARVAVAEGTVLFPRAEIIVDPAAADASAQPAASPREVRETREPREAREVRAVEAGEEAVAALEPDVLVGAGNGAGHATNGAAASANGNGNGNGNGKGSAAAASAKPVVRPLKGWHRR